MNIPETRSCFIHRKRIYFSRNFFTALQHFNGRFSTIIKIESNRFGRNIHHRHIGNPYIFNNTATTTLALKTQSHIRSQELAIADGYITYPATHLTADNETAMAFKYRAAIYHYIFARTCTTAAIFILTAFQTDSVISHIKGRIHNQRVFTRFQIQSVTVLRIARITHLHIFNQHILTHQRMQVPRRRVLENHPLQPHILTLYQTHHHRTKEMTDTLPLFFRFQILGDIHIADSIPFQSFRIRKPVGRTFIYTATGCCLLPDALRNLLTLQRTPVMAVSVNCPFAGYSYIFQVTAGNRRLATTGIQPLKHCFHQRIEVHIRREKDNSPFFQMQVDIAFQYDRPCKPNTGRNNKMSSPLFGKGIDCIGKSRCT